ncbi:phage major tail protein, TP901-1 family [Ligilactobacillus murinus]|uniref:phage major tail protein, TP901-1 family n=1 Tax=Ligilactobacillus murinus TaxID=1622 RepID=UPI00109488CF|nr:phage major tail protein, TP901-1 family [Ligilactobacillus murinus]TGY53639.1 phage major tail protein, TP901-1 family [Ligilactobacillus murinus]
MVESIKTLHGKDTFLFVRKLKDAKTAEGKLIPFQTSLTFDMSRESDTTQTKSGPVTSAGGIETELSVELVNNTSAILDALQDSLLSGDKLEFWVIFAGRKNAQGQYFSFYGRAIVSEDSNDNDADDLSTREISFGVDGTPKRGWTTLPQSAQEAIEYVYRGLEAMGENETTGTAWKDADAGINTEG